MICIDCHRGELILAPGSGRTVACADCHDQQRLQKDLPADITQLDGNYTLRSRADNRDHPLPPMRDLAHTENPDVSCQICHAQWSYDDTTTHPLCTDHEEYDEWTALTVQGSSALEKLLENNLDLDKEELPPITADLLTGENRPSLWYQGYTIHRWKMSCLAEVRRA